MSVTQIGKSSEFVPLAIPLFLDNVPAGFPSPASDYCERKLDLNELCITKPAATYFVRAQGDLFASEANSEHRDKLMQAVDTINHSGQGQIWFGGQRPKRDWFMNQAYLSPAYTTRWECLPLV